MQESIVNIPPVDCRYSLNGANNKANGNINNVKSINNTIMFYLQSTLYFKQNLSASQSTFSHLLYINK